MNLVDSSGWLEYFADAANADFFAAAIEDSASLIVSAINLYEVFKRVRQQRDETQALHAIAIMGHGRVVPVDVAISLHAAQLSIDHQLPMADSLILATARAHDAVLWTQDSDFEGLECVRYIAKTR